MTADAAKAAGLRDPRITTDVKHVEVGPHRQVRLHRLRDAPARARPGDPAGRGPARRRRVRPDRRLRGLRLPHGLAPGGGSDDRVGRARAERRPAGRRPYRRRPGGVRQAPGRAGRSRRGRGPCAARAGGGGRPAAPARRVGGRADGLRRRDGGVLRDAVRARERVPGHSRDGRRGRPGLGAGRLRRGPLRRDDGRAGGSGGDRRLGRHARSRSEGGPCVRGSGASSSTLAGSTCGRSGSSARCAASTPTAARCGSSPSGS